MGKGTILNDFEDGSYSVKLIYAGRERVEGWISEVDAKITALQAKIAELPEGNDKIYAQLLLTSYQKRKRYLQDNMPADRVEALMWCADKTTGMTGDVGTIEIPGELTDGINIQPGYDDQSTYDKTRDGQLLPAVACSPESAYFNRSLLPGWQKWKPTYRYATIVPDSINFEDDTCDLCLIRAFSSQQRLNVNYINPTESYGNCPTAPPAGFVVFCNENPDHPICSNTVQANENYSLSDAWYETIKRINAEVNSSHEYAADKGGLLNGEDWRILEEGEAGDCEDYALTKLQKLLDAGFPIEQMSIAGMGVESTNGPDHGILIIRTKNKGILALDNRYDNVMSLESLPYALEEFQTAGQNWSTFGSYLSRVPIEYMTCNAMAFADLDEVLVKFENQDWAQPKVIGFKSNPKSCGLGNIWIRSVDYVVYSPDKFCYSLVTSTKAFSATQAYNQSALNGSGTMTKDATIFMVGGIRQAGADETSDVVEKWDAITNTWEYKTSYPHEVDAVAGAEFGDFGFIFGGREVSGFSFIMHPDFFRYSFSGDAWQERNFQNETYRDAYAFWSILGKLYIAGGTKLNPSTWDAFPFPRQDSNYEYDNVSNSWTEKETMPDEWEQGFFFSKDNKGYYSGGIKTLQDDGKDLVGTGAGNGYYSSRNYEFDPLTNAYTRKEDFPGISSKSPVDGKADGNDDGGHCIDGINQNTGAVRTYDNLTDTWQDAYALPKVYAGTPQENYLQIHNYAGGAAKAMVNG